MIHCRLASESPRSFWIDGSATFTTVASSTTMNCAKQTSTSTTQGFVEPRVLAIAASPATRLGLQKPSGLRRCRPTRRRRRIGDAPGVVVIVAQVSDRPTIRDVAREAGVSIATVSRALNDKDDVSVETRERVRRAARDLRYTVDPSARALGSQRTRLVAVLVGDNAGPRDMSLIFFGKVLAAISRRLGQQGYEPLLLSERERARRRFDAAIVIGVDGDDPLIDELAQRHVPLVGVDVRCGVGRAAFVGSDHAGGVRLALAHLHSLGHRRIAHIAGARNITAGAERLEAFRSEGERLGLELPDDYVRDGDFSSASGCRE